MEYHLNKKMKRLPYKPTASQWDTPACACCGKTPMGNYRYKSKESGEVIVACNDNHAFIAFDNPYLRVKA